MVPTNGRVADLGIGTFNTDARGQGHDSDST